jgi:hypothetical protein
MQVTGVTSFNKGIENVKLKVNILIPEFALCTGGLILMYKIAKKVFISRGF